MDQNKKDNKPDECYLSPYKTWLSIQSRFQTNEGMFLFVILYKLRINGSFLLMINKIT